VRLRKNGWFKKNKVMMLQEWPAQSPDLNVIETLWGRLAQAVKARAPYGCEALQEFVQEEWDKVDQGTVDRLMEEFIVRCAVCVEQRGRLVTRRHVRAYLDTQRQPAAGKRRNKTRA
jgi:hypothetical protein